MSKMFAKLKKKLEDEKQTDIRKVFSPVMARSPSSSSSRTGSRQSSPTRLLAGLDHSNRGFEKDGAKTMFEIGYSTPSSRRLSQASTDDLKIITPSVSLQSIQDSGDESIEENMEVKLWQKTERVKKLEARMLEYAAANKEHQKTKEKLQQMLEKNQDISAKQLEQNNEEWKAKLDSIQLEMKELLEKLHSTEQLKDKFLQNQEAMDEMEGFQIQELAKVKHMELQLCQENLMQTLADFTAGKETISQLKIEIERLQEHIEMIESERSRLQERDEKQSVLITELQGIKDSYLVKVADMGGELQESNDKLNRARQLVADLRDELDSLKHSQETHRAQSTKALEEKVILVSHLTERVQTLEHRLADSGLNEDDKFQAILSERDGLEKKLEESRQHLNDIKSTWSDKIVNLEKQISNLNEKIGDDSSELRRLEEESISKHRIFEAQGANLEEKLRESESIRQELQKSLAAREDDIVKQNESLSLKQGQLNSLQNVLTDRSRQEEVISVLSKSVDEHIEAEQALQTKVAELEISLEDKKCSLSSIQSKLSETEIECKRLQNDITKLVESNTAMAKEVEILRKDMNDQKVDFEAKITSLETTLRSTESEIKELRLQFCEAEETAASNVTNSALLADLRATASDLETQLADRNKMVKLQQQRISDMKKTLQRELRMQSGPGEGSNGECLADSNGGLVGSSSSSLTTGSHLNANASTNNHCPNLSGGSFVADPGDTTEDINFRYLKHVILKFMTSREYEAQHLIKAVSVLLHFTSEEQRLIKETLEWKMSWFGSKPSFPKSIEAS